MTRAIKTRVRIRLYGQTLEGARVIRKVWMCGPESVLVLKALAFRNRGEAKDAYDLYYVLKHHDLRPVNASLVVDVSAGIGARLHTLRDRDPIDPDAIDAAVRTLREDFAGIDGLGPPERLPSLRPAWTTRCERTSSPPSLLSSRRSERRHARLPRPVPSVPPASSPLGQAAPWLADDGRE